MAEYEVLKEPKFYKNENFTTLENKLPYYGGSLEMKYPSSVSETRYIANEDGVLEEYDCLDEDGKVMWTMKEIILPKEAFIVAYNAYIKGNK